MLAISALPASGVAAMLGRGPSGPSFDAAPVLEAGGCRFVRLLGEREGLRFVEGTKAARVTARRPAYLRQVRCLPPSTGIVSPVIHAASSDARNRIIAATSSGCPGRPSGCVSFDR